jgi:RNA polymerase sigma-70 factor (ECF subfamily)
LNAEVENKLVASARKGDRTAYARLVETYSGRVFAICLGTLGDRHDAEDLAQQTLLRGFVQINHLRNAQRFGAWIAQIARHLCIDAIRRQKAQVLAPPSDAGTGDGDPEAYRRLEGALAKLKPDYRMPLLLFYFDGRSTRSIAETLGISQAAVQTRLSRARRELRDYLGTEGSDHE